MAGACRINKKEAVRKYTGHPLFYHMNKIESDTTSLLLPATACCCRLHHLVAGSSNNLLPKPGWILKISTSILKALTIQFTIKKGCIKSWCSPSLL